MTTPIADYAIVGDMFKIVPALTRRLREHLTQGGGDSRGVTTVLIEGEDEPDEEEKAG